MKTLSNLMMSDFIDMLCGNVNVLREDGEEASQNALKEHGKKLTLNYKMIVNPASVKAIIYSQAESQRRRAKWHLLKNCRSLLSFGGLAEALSVLESIGYNLKDKSLSAVKSKIDSEMRYIEFMQKRENEMRKDEKKNDIGIRESFDREQAAMMTYYKMLIDMRNVSASVYANMIAQAERELKLRKQALDRVKY